MKILTLKNENNTLENINLDAFLAAEAINYGFADNPSEKSRLEDVLNRQIKSIGEDQEGEWSQLVDPELIEITYSACSVLAIVNKLELDFSDYFEGNFDEEEIEYSDEWDDHVHNLVLGSDENEEK